VTRVRTKVHYLSDDCDISTNAVPTYLLISCDSSISPSSLSPFTCSYRNETTTVLHRPDVGHVRVAFNGSSKRKTGGLCEGRKAVYVCACVCLCVCVCLCLRICVSECVRAGDRVQETGKYNIKTFVITHTNERKIKLHNEINVKSTTDLTIHRARFENI